MCIYIINVSFFLTCLGRLASTARDKIPLSIHEYRRFECICMYICINIHTSDKVPLSNYHVGHVRYKCKYMCIHGKVQIYIYKTKENINLWSDRIVRSSMMYGL